MSETKLRIGYIPLVDAAALMVAVDCGFAAAEGLTVELVREVSWSNVRDKLNIGLFDAAHLLSPVAIASSLGIGHVRVPIIAPFNLGLNGNAITVSPRLYADLSSLADGDLADPKVSARALARVVAERKARGADPLTFGMTFPFSHHNYQLRFWMAAGGVDPDEDVRLVVLPPPYMVESLASGHVDGFCVGAPWNSVAVDFGIGHILHFGCEIRRASSEKVLAVREQWASENPDTVAALVRALAAPPTSSRTPDNLTVVSDAIARRLGVEPELIVRALDRQFEDRAGWRSSAATTATSWSAATAPAGPIRCRRRGSTRRWCAGAKRRCRRNRSPSRNPSSAPISTTPRSAARRRRATASRATASAPSSGPISPPPISRVIWRPGASSVPDARGCRWCVNFCTAQLFRSMRLWCADASAAMPD